MIDRPVSSVAAGAYLAQQPRITVLGVDYLHLRMEDGSDLYVTQEGLPFVSQLLPQNYWTDEQWFAQHHVKLPGTSAVYRITTKDIDGYSKDIVLKWNRMGQDIPGETHAAELSQASFNSPFEEFSLVTEMRGAFTELPGSMGIHTPLAIYVPRKYVEMDRLGRRRHRIEEMQKEHQEVMLDANRQYAVIYGWINGIDAARALGDRIIDQAAVRDLLARSNREMEERGFRVLDSKPQHLIVRPLPEGGLAKDRDGNTVLALVDFELLERTPQHEEAIRQSKRKNYLVKQAHRFEAREDFPPGLSPIRIMDVDYVYGQVESTGGALWVVGRDPMLFDYFLPEKWRTTARTRLSFMSHVYGTVTKDSIHLVWRLSRVGERPDADPYIENERKILAHGFNSPFEEISFAMELSRKGIATTYPRAIYRSGHKLRESDRLADNSRYESHEPFSTDDGHPILGRHHDYMTLWGYWNGPDELLASKDEEHYSGIDALRAFREGLITEKVYLLTLRTTRTRLARAGFEDLSLRGNHLLLSMDKSGQLVMDEQGIPAARICSFELLRRISG